MKNLKQKPVFMQTPTTVKRNHIIVRIRFDKNTMSRVNFHSFYKPISKLF